MNTTEQCRSWFCVWNNPKKNEEYENLTEKEIAENVLDIWIAGKESRSGAVAYCISADGLEHLHLCLCNENMVRFSVLKSLYPKAHIEPTKGTKQQAEDYIHKRGKFEEKGEKVLYIAKYGEIKSNQGQRKDLDIIDELIQEGKTPQEIMSLNINYRRYEKIIKSAYFSKRDKETPFIRPVNVVWHVGESGSGKSYTAYKLVEEKGEDYIYRISNYENGCFDEYNGEPVLFLDEYRSQFRYSDLLTLLDVYKSSIHARYSNVKALWNEVHITSVLSPDMCYAKMVENNNDIDTLLQLYRRINTIVYHFKADEEYHSYYMPMSEFKNLNQLRYKALAWLDIKRIPFNIDDFEEID